MKNGKRLLCTVCAGIVALCLLLSGCSILGKKEEKVRDLTITPVSDSGLPQELQTLIKQKTSAPFKMTYTTDEMGPVIKKLYDTLTGIQMGRIEAPEGWIRKIC